MRTIALIVGCLLLVVAALLPVVGIGLSDGYVSIQTRITWSIGLVAIALLILNKARFR